MGISHRRHIADELRAGGLDNDTPIAVVERAWTPTQRVVRGRLRELGDLEVTNPAVIVIGPVAALSLNEIHSLVESAS